MVMAAPIAMSTSAHHIMAWLSPAFPTGAFAYSHGLEYAIHLGQVYDADSCEDWIKFIITQGAGWNDALLLCHAYRGDDVADLASTLCNSAERLQETMDQGRAFARTASKLLDVEITPAALPVVMAHAARQADVPLNEFLPLTLHAFASNLISVAIRLVPLGQTDGQIILQNLFAVFSETATNAQGTSLDDLGTASILADIASMKHETMTTRIFRT